MVHRFASATSNIPRPFVGCGLCAFPSEFKLCCDRFQRSHRSFMGLCVREFCAFDDWTQGTNLLVGIQHMRTILSYRFGRLSLLDLGFGLWPLDCRIHWSHRDRSFAVLQSRRNYIGNWLTGLHAAFMGFHEIVRRHHRRKCKRFS